MTDPIQFTNPADQYTNLPGHWTPDIERQNKIGGNLKCVHCLQGYDAHNPWPQLPCPEKTKITAITQLSRDVMVIMDVIQNLRSLEIRVNEEDQENIEDALLDYVACNYPDQHEFIENRLTKQITVEEAIAAVKSEYNQVDSEHLRQLLLKRAK